MLRRKPKLSRANQHRRSLNMECLEGRRVMATGFLQGIAFHDANSDQSLGVSETTIPNTTIKLLDSTGTTVLQSTTTDSNGRYIFTGLTPGSYRLQQTPAAGFISAGTQTNKSRLNAASGIDAGTIAVTVQDPDQINVNYAGFDTSLYQTVNLTFSAGPTFTASGSAGVMKVSLGTTPNATDISTQFRTFCVNLLEPIPFAGPITFTGTPVPAGLGVKSGEIGYLYNHFADTVSSPAEAAGLQFAIWELIYDGASPNLSAGNLIFNGPGPFNSAMDFAAAMGFANGFLSQAVGKSEPVTVLAGSGNANEFQSMLATGSLNFANVQPASIGNFVWNDANANGKQDGGEPGIQGVTVTLSGTNTLGSVSASMTTDGTGNYSFNNLLPGSYTVTVASSNFATGGPLVNYLASPSGAVGTTTANDSNGSPANVTLAAGQNDTTIDFGFYVPGPGINIDKTANKTNAAPFELVTYTYAVTNPGNVPLSTVTVKDDAGTPTFAGDDFLPVYQSGDVSNIGFLDQGETWIYKATVIPPVNTTATVNGQTYSAGVISTVLSGGDVKVTYLQNFGINDNTYGTGAAAYWPGGNHTFNHLVGSDKLRFQFKDATGKVVLDFYMDYISASSSYASGYGSLGATGGDGSMVLGSAANILNYTTSLTQNLALNPTNSSLKVNSPPPTSIVGGIPTSATWDYINSYTVTVKASTFGTAGFGSVSFPDQHNSPSKLGVNSFPTVLTNSTVTNEAVATAKYNSTTVSDWDTAIVNIVASSPSSSTVTAGTRTLYKNTTYVSLTNQGSTAAVLSKIVINWPSSNGKLRKVTLAGKNLYDTATSPSSVTITSFKGSLSDRTIAAGQTKQFKLEFEKTATSGPYSIQLTFTNGSTLQIN